MKPWSFGESCRHKSWKSWTQTISTCRDVCDKVLDKPVCVALMEFSLLHCTGKVGNKVRGLWRGHKSWKSMTWFVSRTFMICVHDTSATMSGTCPGLCRKVGVMEFGLIRAITGVPLWHWFFSFLLLVMIEVQCKSWESSHNLFFCTNCKRSWFMGYNYMNVYHIDGYAISLVSHFFWECCCI